MLVVPAVPPAVTVDEDIDPKRDCVSVIVTREPVVTTYSPFKLVVATALLILTGGVVGADMPLVDTLAVVTLIASLPA